MWLIASFLRPYRPPLGTAPGADPEHSTLRPPHGPGMPEEGKGTQVAYARADAACCLLLPNNGVCLKGIVKPCWLHQLSSP